MGTAKPGAEIAPRCPVTGGLPTRMTEPAFRAACEAKSGADTRDWRYKRCKDQPPKPLRCRQCDGRRDNWPAELAITQEEEPMSTTTKTTKPATKKPDAKPEPTPTIELAPPAVGEIAHAQYLAGQMRVIESQLDREDVNHDASPADQVRELVSALHDARDKLAATIAVLSGHFGAGRDPVRLAQNAVSCCRDLEEQAKAATPADPVARVIKSTILSGRGEIHVVIRPYAAPASTPTEAQP